MNTFVWSYEATMFYRKRLTLNEGDIFVTRVYVHRRPDGNPRVYDAGVPHMVFEFSYWQVGRNVACDDFKFATIYAQSFREALRGFYRFLRLLAGGASHDEATEIVNYDYETLGKDVTLASIKQEVFPFTHAQIKAR